MTAAVLEVPEIDVIALAAFLTACGVIIWAIRGLFRFGARINQFFDDWYGTEADAAHDAQPGVLTRLNLYEELLAKHILDEETSLASLASEVNDVKLKVGYELTRNGGGSMKDASHEALRVVREVQMQQEHDVIAQREWRRKYETDQVSSLRQRASFLAVVRRLIPLPPDEQLAAFDEAISAYIGEIPPVSTD